QYRVDRPRSRPTATAARGWAGTSDPRSPARESRAHRDQSGAGRMTTPTRARTLVLAAALCAAGACMGPGSDALTGLATASGGGYMLVASASGMASVTSAPFTVFGATASAARAP